MTDHEKRIREALEAGPTEREWLIDHRDPRFVYALNVEGYNQFWAHVQGPHTRTFELEANARLIAACNPSAIRALLADLDAARAALSEAKAGGWQPIETAPKDGTEILLLFGNAEYILGKPHGRVRAACWTGSGSSANWSIPYFKDDAPTAWQPLPAPPAQKEPT